MSQPPYPDDPVLRALVEYWDDVMRLADDGQRELLRGLVAGTVESDPIDTLVMLTDVLLEVLPAEHPLVEVLRTGTMLSTGHGAAEVELSLLHLRSLVLPPGPDLGAPRPVPATEPEPGSPAPELAPQPAEEPHRPASPQTAGEAAAAWDDFDREVRARLLALPAFSPEELRGQGVDPDRAGLIKLVRQDREVQVPAFQFSGVGRPWPVVLEVNGLLDAADDPWGVTCWWVDQHAALDAAPADLLGQGRDGLLVEAAVAVGDED